MADFEILIRTVMAQHARK